MTHGNQGFEVLVVLSRFPLVHRVEIGAIVVVLTGGLEGLSESTFETTVTGQSEAQAVWRIGRTKYLLETDLQ